ncbi:MAG: 3-hydroxyacyl-[acyl-carrier-protein] dehydratase FabZ [Oribacterium sp.]|nr:3-hydroxyacyl-[acyl-carrier-protein] dehydratase FabZ [Oribacterium sp.]
MHNKVFSLDAVELLKYQPNRYPFLLIDRITEVLPGKYAKGYKNITNNEWYIPVHFPGDPNMPGCLQVEAMAQILTVAILTTDGMEGKIVHGYKHSGTFHREVKPGDRLEMCAEILSFRRGLCKGKVKGYIDGQITCELESTIIIPDIFNKFKPKVE